MSHFNVEAEDISEDDYEALSQASNQSQFKFEENLECNFEDDSDYLPSSQDSSSQEFSQVKRDDAYNKIKFFVSSTFFCSENSSQPLFLIFNWAVGNYAQEWGIELEFLALLHYITMQIGQGPISGF